MNARREGWATLQQRARARKLALAQAARDHSERTGQAIVSRPLAFWVGMLARSQLQQQTGAKGSGNK